MLSMSDAETFTMVLEKDGSSVPADVITAVIDDNEKIGTLMVLRPNQFWTPGSNFFMICVLLLYCCWFHGGGSQDIFSTSKTIYRWGINSSHSVTWVIRTERWTYLAALELCITRIMVKLSYNAKLIV